MQVTLGDIYEFYNQYPEEKGNILVETRYGYYPILWCDITAPNSEVIEVQTENKKIQAAPKHRVIKDNKWAYVEDLKINDKILTKDGYEKVVSIKKLDKKEDLYDIEVAEVHEYYGNGIVSHNSTFLDSITFALFGKPYRKIKLSNLVNNKNNKELLVELYFQIKNDNYKIIRGIKPNIFEIYKNDKLIHQDGNVRDYQLKLEDILGFNELLFRQVIVLGAGINKNISEMSSKEKEEFFQNITNTYLINIVTEIAKQKYKELITKQQEFDYKRTLLIQTIASLESEYEKIERQNKELEKLNKENKDKLKQDLEKLNKAIEIINTKINELQNQIKNINHNEINDLYKKQSKIEYELQQFNKGEKVTCPFCNKEFIPGQKPKEYKVKMENALKLINEKINTLEQDIKFNEDINNKINELKNKKYTIELKISSINNELNKIENYKYQQIDYSTLNNKKQELENTEKELKNLELTITKYKKLLNILTSGKIKEQLLEQQVLPILNQKIQKYLEKFEVEFSFAIQSNLKEKIIYKGDELEFNNLSNGQKQRVILSILFAFIEVMQENGFYFNVLILDEFLDNSLDVTGIDIVISILEELKQNRDIIIITHNKDILSLIEPNRYFEAVKEIGFSKLERRI
jgi:DNA repair exonuclease SbcCD ATPase subunit